MMSILLALLLSPAAGFLLVRALWPGSLRRWESADWLRLPLGAFAGLGLSSIPAFFAAPGASPMSWDIGFLGASALLCAVFGRAVQSEDPEATTNSPVWMPAVWISAAIAATSAFALYLTTKTNPHGDFDAWRVWNFRPRFLFRGETLQSLADPLLSWTHPEFPHLLTGSILRCWRWQGTDSQDAPMAIAGLFTIFVPMALFGALRLLRTPAQAWVGLAALLGSTLFITAGSTQIADVPMAAYVFGSLACVLCAEKLQRGRIAILAGLLAGLATWLKFEGAFYAVALLAIAAWRLRAGGALRFAAGALPGLAITVYFLKTIAPAASPHAIGAAPFNLLLAIGLRLLDFTYMGWAVTPVVVFAVYAYFVGFDRRKQNGLEIWLPLAVLFLAGCTAVVVRDDNPGDTAGIRLVLHVWPVLLLSLFRQTNAPEELAVQPQVATPARQKSRK